MFEAADIRDLLGVGENLSDHPLAPVVYAAAQAHARRDQQSRRGSCRGAQALAPWRQEELLPGVAVTAAARQRDFLRRSTGAYWHSVGTCRIGTDHAAVTDGT